MVFFTQSLRERINFVHQFIEYYDSFDMAICPLQEMSRQLYGRRGHDNPAHSYDFEFTSSSASPNFDDGDDFVNDDDFFWKRTLDSELVCTCL